jgi:uncharacterized glyoxalase superfamily protein PhnB
MYDPRRGYPSVGAYVRYRDPAAAIAWLSAVLGAREAIRMTLPDGRIGHAELVLDGHVIPLGVAAVEGEAARPAARDAVRAMTLVFDGSTDMPWGLRQAIVTDPEGHV